MRFGLVPLMRRARPFAAALALPVLSAALLQVPSVRAIEPAPTPRAAAAKEMAPDALDRELMKEITDNSELMKNLQYLSDEIGPRLTGSKNLKRANDWAAEKMKSYGLEDVKLEGWEIPIGWERGTASLKLVEPDTGVRCTVAAWAWTPGTKGKVTGPVVVLRGRTMEDLKVYKDKLKDAIVLLSSPGTVGPVTDTSYGPLSPGAKKDAPKEEAKKDEPKKDEKKKDEKQDEPQYAPAEEEAQQPKDEKKDEPKEAIPFGDGRIRGIPRELMRELDDFLIAEGVACRLLNSRKPHNLLMMSGQWRPGDRATPQDVMPQLAVAHEYYAMLFRLASRKGAVTKAEVEITNTFVPGPIEVFNTVGEVRGSEKPDEFVVVGAHLDSWDLGTGTTDNGTGSCVVLETARAVAALAKRGYPPKRTIRFCLFTGEEQGLHGSKQYVIRHKEEMPKTSAALVHDTGTGRVTGFGLHGWESAKKMLDPELASLATMEGWKGLDLGGVQGSDHQSFHPAGVPGFCCRQDIDEYKFTHHTQSDTFDHAKGPNLKQGGQVMAVTCVRAANLPELLPRERIVPKKDEPKKDEPKK